MKRLTTLLAATAIGIGLLAAPAVAQQEYPIDVAPIIVERPDAPAVVPPQVPDVAPAVPAAPRPAAQLAVTGSDVTVGAALALMLLLTGSAAVWYARRRRLAAI